MVIKGHYKYYKLTSVGLESQQKGSILGQLCSDICKNDFISLSVHSYVRQL